MTPLESILQARLTPIVADLDRSSIEDAEAVITVVCGRWGLIVSAHRAEFVAPPDTPPAAPADKPLTVPRRREVEQNALDAASVEGLTVAQLAARAGYAANSYFRAAVAALLNAGLLERTGRKVRLASGDSQR